MQTQRTLPLSSNFLRAKSTVLELAPVHCTSHQSNFFAASWYRAPCSAKQNLDFRSRLELEAPAALRSATPLKRLLVFPSSLITRVTKCPSWTSAPLAQGRFAAVLPAFSPYSHASRTWRRGGRLIANLELEFRINPIRITKLKFSNRKFLAISSFPTRSAHRESRATEFLIENARLNFELSGNDSSHLQISNRERIGVSCSAAPSQSLQSSSISNLQSRTSHARRIRDTCTDIPSPRAFPRCYASCGSRRKSE